MEDNKVLFLALRISKDKEACQKCLLLVLLLTSQITFTNYTTLMLQT